MKSWVLGLTGGIASGKSTVAQMFERRGYVWIDADAIARRIVEPGQPALAEIVERFGPQMLLGDGTLDRARLGRLVFAEPEQRAALNAITHPRIGERVAAELKEHARHGRRVLLDHPLLFETGQETLVDRVAVVYVDRSTQLERLMLRNDLTREEAEQRIAAQMDLEEKAQRADFVIDNRGSPPQTELQVEEICRSLADPFEDWYAALEARHLETLTFQEVRRGLQALSSLYVERRERLASGKPFDGAGKRAAYALFYGPLHFLVLRQIVRALGGGQDGLRRIVELGCGTGAAGLAWALEVGRGCRLEGVDRSDWAVAEARWTAQALGVEAQFRVGSMERVPQLGAGDAVLAAFAVNELEDSAREQLLAKLLQAADRGAGLLIVEPIARAALPWWDDWAAAFLERDGREDLWKFRANLPELWKLLDKAAGLRHQELKARSLWLAPRRP